MTVRAVRIEFFERSSTLSSLLLVSKTGIIPEVVINYRVVQYKRTRGSSLMVVINSVFTFIVNAEVIDLFIAYLLIKIRNIRNYYPWKEIQWTRCHIV